MTFDLRNTGFSSIVRMGILLLDWLCCTCLLDAISLSSSALVVKVMRSCNMRAGGQ